MGKIKFYHLYPLDYSKTPFDQYDINLGFIIAAFNAKQARLIASKQVGDENCYYPSPWLNKELTRCERLRIPKSPKVILKERRPG